MEVAKTILQQLGGNRFTVMTGAKNYRADSNSLTMDLPRNKTGAKYLTIKLNAMDTYDITFRKMNGFEVVTVKEFENIYNDQLVELFERETGLYTSL